MSSLFPAFFRPWTKDHSAESIPTFQADTRLFYYISYCSISQANTPARPQGTQTKEPCLLQADRQQRQLIPPALISSRSSSKGSLIPLRRSQAACKSCCAFMGFRQESAVLLGICKARSLGGHPGRSYYCSKEDTVVKKQLPSLPHHLSLTWHPKNQHLPLQHSKPWQKHGEGITGSLSLTWPWHGPTSYCFKVILHSKKPPVTIRSRKILGCNFVNKMHPLAKHPHN